MEKTSFDVLLEVQHELNDWIHPENPGITSTEAFDHIVEIKEIIDNFFNDFGKEEFKDHDPKGNDQDIKMLRVVAKAIEERDHSAKAASKAIADYIYLRNE